MELPISTTYFFEPKKIEIIPSKNYLPSCLLVSIAAHIALVAFLITPIKKIPLDLPQIKPSSSITFQISHPTVSIAKNSSPAIKAAPPKPVIKKTINKPAPAIQPVVKHNKVASIPEPQTSHVETNPGSVETGNASISSGGFGEISNVAKTNYESILANWLERYRAYPSRALRRRITGEGLLYVMINQQGKVLDYKLEKSTNEPMLDEAIISMLKKADPLPKIPSEFSVTQYEFTVPVDFKIN